MGQEQKELDSAGCRNITDCSWLSSHATTDARLRPHQSMLLNTLVNLIQAIALLQTSLDLMFKRKKINKTILRVLLLRHQNLIILLRQDNRCFCQNCCLSSWASCRLHPHFRHTLTVVPLTPAMNKMSPNWHSLVS